MRRVAALLVLSAVLTTTACASSSAANVPGPDFPSGLPTSTGPTPAVTSGEGMPTVDGGFGTKPTINFPDADAPGALQIQVLVSGTGTVVAKGDLLVTNYVGQVWKGKVFDSSFARSAPVGFPIGTGKVITGWDTSLVGLKVGTRALLSIPPAQGYGSKGNTSAGIAGTDTIVFVVDIVGAFNAKSTGDPAAAPQTPPAGGPQVTGALGERPKITIAAGMATPATVTTVVLAKGNGAPVKAGLLVVQYEAVDWTSVIVGSTWAKGIPESLQVGGDNGAAVFAGVVGLPLGSRVLVEIPATTGASPQKPLALVVDLVAQV